MNDNKIILFGSDQKIYWMAPSVCDEWKEVVTKLIVMDYIDKIKGWKL